MHAATAFLDRGASTPGKDVDPSRMIPGSL
jgi:hypothetical protein